MYNNNNNNNNNNTDKINIKNNNEKKQLIPKKNNNKIKNNDKKKKIKKKTPGSHLRWIVLILASLVTLGDYYVFDNPSSLHSQLKKKFNDQEGNTFEIYFNLLYSVYSIPNIILPFFGGYLLDTIGIRIMIVLFSSLVCFGQFITAIGCQIESMPIMLLGRVFFGLGGECLNVGQSALVGAWFEGHELAAALGFNLSMSRFGSVINNFVSPYVAKEYNVAMAFWVGVLVCLFSLVSALLLICIDKRVEKKKNKKKKINSNDKISYKSINNNDDNNNQEDYSDIDTDSDTENDIDDIDDIEKDWHVGNYFQTPTIGRNPDFMMSPSPVLNIRPPMSPYKNKSPFSPYSMMKWSLKNEPLNKNQKKLKQIKESNNNEKNNDETNKNNDEKINVSDIKNFKLSFWLITISCMLCYGVLMPFNNISNALLMQDYISTSNDDEYDCSKKPLPISWIKPCDRIGDEQTETAILQSIPYTLSAILSPILGGAIDKWGLRTFFITLAPTLLFGSHILLGLGFDPIGPLIGIGLAFSIFASVIWPASLVVVRSNHKGTALGILTVFQNFSMSVVPIIVASLFDIRHSYGPGEFLFASISLIGIVNGIILWVVDSKDGGILTKPEIEVQKIKRKLERKYKKEKKLEAREKFEHDKKLFENEEKKRVNYPYKHDQRKSLLKRTMSESREYRTYST